MSTGLFTSRRAAFLATVLAVLALAVFSPRVAIEAQVTDFSGYITSGNWLVLGPFAQPNSCGGSPGLMAQNYVAPTRIQCEYPQAGDTIEYDPSVSASTGYVGPPGAGGAPAWRAFSDGSANCDIDLAADVGAPGKEYVVSFLATYVEYLGAGAIDVDVCANADDGAQVWVDNSLAVNHAICRGRGGCAAGACDDVGTVTLEPGVHRILMGIWQGCCGWGGSLRLQVAGVPILDTDPDWLFHGTDPAGHSAPCIPLPTRAVSGLGDPTACPPASGGPVEVKITQEGGSPAEVVSVVERVLGAVTPAMVAAANGGSVAALPADPLAPVGIFDDHRNVIVNPLCPAGNGDTIEGPPGTYQVTNVGEDIWAGGDSFQFAYKKVRGDFDVTAHIASRIPAPGSRWGKHGIMARHDLTPRSRYAYTQDNVGDVTAAVHNNDDSTHQAGRRTHGGADNFEQSPYPKNPSGDGIDDYCDGVGPDDGACTVVHHDYLRLQRIGNAFTSYSRSSPAEAWNVLGRTDWGPYAPADIYVGLSATSHTGACGAPIEIVFDEVDFGGATIVPLAAPPPVGVEITWNVPRSVLQGAGLSYSVDIDEGRVELDGAVEGLPIAGDSAPVIFRGPPDFGPFANPDFPHAHAIGMPCSGGNVESPSPGTIVVSGAGNDIWQGGDEFVFAYKPVQGEFSARVRVTNRDFAPGSRWGKHGIMARQDCTDRSRYTFLHDQGEDLQDTTRLAVRPTHGGADNIEITPLVGGLHWDTLRLDRQEDTFVGLVLDELGLLGNPGEWFEIGRWDWGPGAPDTVLIGLAVTSHQACDVTSITFEDWDLSLGPPALPVTDLACTQEASGDVTLTWRNSPGANPGVPISIRIEGAEILTVAGSATSATVAAAELPASEIFAIQVVNSSGIPATCTVPGELSPEGFIKTWLMLGPFAQAGGANPPQATIRRDYLTDGAGKTQTNIEPKAGDTVNTAFGGAAASTGLQPTPQKPDLNPGGVPTWNVWADSDDTINFDDYHGSNVDEQMNHAFVYIDVGEARPVNIGLASDDSVQVLLDGQEIWINSVARGYDAANIVQDTVLSSSVPQLNPLSKGLHKLLVKVFDGTGGSGFRLRFQDAAGLPISAGKILLAPGGGPEKPKFRRGDPNSDGVINITDGIYILNFLFLGGPPPACTEAANPNDDASVNITDGIYVLNFLFLGGPAPVAPGINCGPDPDGSTSDLGCTGYTKC